MNKFEFQMIQHSPLNEIIVLIEYFGSVFFFSVSIENIVEKHGSYEKVVSHLEVGEDISYMMISH